ncbi:MAG TPA: hypothetical protein VE779_13985 [Candidatus Angelobacter sp.]|nr:hypothetical protein [Candidatus Angelobacter sp.]
MAPSSLKGSVLGIILYDVCEEIRLEELRRILDAKRTAPVFKHATPEYVRFQNPPVVETLDPIQLSGGERVQPQVKYYDYGVVSVLIDRRFEGDWQSLTNLAASWVPNAELERLAEDIVRRRLLKIEPALVRPYEQWLSEDYYVFLLNEVEGRPQGADLLRDRGPQIAQIVCGEATELARAEQDDVLEGSLSYYPRDLIVIGWNAAMIYDTPSGAVMSVEILEYVNSQLLEFRHYDELLTRELDGVYKSLKSRASFWRRWQMRREASRLNTVALEVTDLVERCDTAIKFVSDMFAARLYRLAVGKVGVPEYQNLVNEKLKMSEGLYRFFIDEFHQSSGFVLEVMVVIILIIDLIFLFRGKG